MPSRCNDFLVINVSIHYFSFFFSITMKIYREYQFGFLVIIIYIIEDRCDN
jgi:hypothetical protein